MADYSVSNLAGAHYIGTNSDRAKFDPDGSLSFEGAATVFEDMEGPINGSNLFGVPGKADYSFAEVCVVFEPEGALATNGDVVELRLQVRHKAKVDSPLKLHIHWEQIDATAREFTYVYRVQKQLQAKTTTWSDPIVVSTGTAGVNADTYVSGTLNQISRLGDISLVDAGISAIVQIKLTRTDAVAGNINVTSIDAHYEIDTLGSRQEYIK